MGTLRVISTKMIIMHHVSERCTDWPFKLCLCACGGGVAINKFDHWYLQINKQGKSEEFDSFDWLHNIFLKLDRNRCFFSAYMTLGFNKRPDKTKGNLFHAPRSCLCCHPKMLKSEPDRRSCTIWYPSMNLNWSLEKLNLGQNWQFIAICDLEIWHMTLKNNRALLLWPFKLCASFCSHLQNQNRVTVHKCPNWEQICLDFCDLDLWPLSLTFCVCFIFVNSNYSWQI